MMQESGYMPVMYSIASYVANLTSVMHLPISHDEHFEPPWSSGTPSQVWRFYVQGEIKSMSTS